MKTRGLSPYWEATFLTNSALGEGELEEEGCTIYSNQVLPHDYTLACKFSHHLLHQGLGLWL